MSELSKTLPFILGAAVSPVLLLTTIIILAQAKKPIAKAILFLFGSTLTITSICLVVFYTATFRNVGTAGKDELVHVVIGLLLIFLAIDIYRRGPAKPKPSKKHNSGIWPYFILGIGLMLTNFTTIAMVFAVAVEIRDTSAEDITKLIYMFATIISSLLPILLPLGVLVVTGKNSQRVLNILSKFMNRYAHIITAVFFALLGVFSLVKPFL